MIEPINDTTFEVTLSGGDKVEIGDKESADFKPHIKLNRWDGECFIKVQMAGDIEGEVEYELEEDKVKTKCKIKYGDFEQEVETEFYPLEPTEQFELGGFEFEIILSEKPATDKIVLDIKAQGLKFEYQPALTLEEIADGIIRPDNVLGSYAVYHATKRNHILGQTNYSTGKAFHIYRPKIEDADGNWVWGELHYDEQAGTLTTTIPQNFLDIAVYPIRHAVGNTFGITSIGATVFICDFIKRRGYDTYLGGEGTGNSLSAYVRGAGGDGVFSLALYNTSDVLIGSTASEVAPASGSAELYTIDFISEPELSAIQYALAIWGNSNQTYISIDTTGAGGTALYHQGGSYPTWPASISWVSGGGPYVFSIYCDYAPGVPPAEGHPYISRVQGVQGMRSWGGI